MVEAISVWFKVRVSSLLFPELELLHNAKRKIKRNEKQITTTVKIFLFENVESHEVKINFILLNKLPMNFIIYNPVYL